MFELSTLTPTGVYFLNLLDIARSVLTAFAFIAGCVTFTAIAAAFLSRVDPGWEDFREIWKSFGRRMVSVFAVLLVVSCAIPSSKVVAAMYLLPTTIQRLDQITRNDAALEALRDISQAWIKASE